MVCDFWFLFGKHLRTCIDTCTHSLTHTHKLLRLVKVQSGSFSPLEIYTSNPFFRRRQWQPTLVLLPGKSHGQRSLVRCSPWGHKELDTTERLHFYFSLSCTGEGNGNPLQYSCLENPRDRGAWWAAVYGVAQSWTRLKWLSSSSSNPFFAHLWIDFLMSSLQ